MLDRILPDFQSRFWTESAESLISQTLKEENARILNPDHLQAQVIGKGEFAWDFRSLDAGFWDLVSLYTTKPSGSSHLLLLALDELQVGKPERLSLIPIIEYSHFASLVNDHYNLHPDLNREKPDRFAAAKLTQLKYAAQFMVVYPKYLVLRNCMAADLATRNRLHTAMFQLTVMAGSSRASFLHWSRRAFDGVTPENCLQWSVNTMSGYFLGPVKLACILAGVPAKKLEKMKQAFSWLTIAVKLELERRVINGETEMPDEPHRQPAFIVDSFPASYWVKFQQKHNHDVSPYDAFPDFKGLYDRVLNDLRNDSAGEVARLTDVDEALDKFSNTMAGLSLLPTLTDKLISALMKGGSKR